MPQLRKDPITDRWVIIATERAKRPKDFKIIRFEGKKEGFCPFCYGNEDKTPAEIMGYRPDGSKPNSPGWSLRVIPNKFPALMIEGGLMREGEGVYDKMNGVGAHEVIIESPDHMKSIADFTERQIEDVFWAYRDRVLDLKKDGRFKYILIFKNHGEAAGASLEHTHSQLIALPIIPRIVQDEMDGSRIYYQFKERCIYCDIIRQEIASDKRIVYQNENFVVVEPFAPRFPFETWILPKHHDSCFEDCQKNEYKDLANAFKILMQKLRKALDNPAYNFLLHTSPFNENINEYYHWHFEVMPILTKVAGFEWGTGFYINPTPPEEAAAFLKGLTID